MTIRLRLLKSTEGEYSLRLDLQVPQASSLQTSYVCFCSGKIQFSGAEDASALREVKVEKKIAPLLLQNLQENFFPLFQGKSRELIDQLSIISTFEANNLMELVGKIREKMSPSLNKVDAKSAVP